MSRFIQLHLLTSYPPANLNRDDSGRPKTAIMGGSERLRVSSQSLKRAWRCSEIFQKTVGEGFIGTRTRNIGESVVKKLQQGGVNEKKALAWAQKIAEQFGKLANKKSNANIEQLVHLSQEEQTQINQLVAVLIERQSEPETEELNLLRKQNRAVDMALFGRMLASFHEFNVEAAAQVAHAISVHKVVLEDDFFTAIDDLNAKKDTGSAHMGETEFAAGLFYLYICIDKSLLSENLQQDSDLVNKTLTAFCQTTTQVAPTGKQNSFASRAYASYLMAEKGDEQPRSLSVAYLKPVIEGKQGMLTNAIKSLEETRNNMNQVYGQQTAMKTMNSSKGTGSLADIIQFVTE